MESPIIRLAQKFIGGFLDDGTEKSECTFWPTQYNLTAPLKNKYKTIVKEQRCRNVEPDHCDLVLTSEFLGSQD